MLYIYIYVICMTYHIYKFSSESNISSKKKTFFSQQILSSSQRLPGDPGSREGVGDGQYHVPAEGGCCGLGVMSGVYPHPCNSHGCLMGFLSSLKSSEDVDRACRLIWGQATLDEKSRSIKIQVYMYDLPVLLFLLGIKLSTVLFEFFLYPEWEFVEKTMGLICLQILDLNI